MEPQHQSPQHPRHRRSLLDDRTKNLRYRRAGDRLDHASKSKADGTKIWDTGGWVTGSDHYASGSNAGGNVFTTGIVVSEWTSRGKVPDHSAGKIHITARASTPVCAPSLASIVGRPWQHFSKYSKLWRNLYTPFHERADSGCHCTDRICMEKRQFIWKRPDVRH